MSEYPPQTKTGAAGKEKSLCNSANNGAGRADQKQGAEVWQVPNACDGHNQFCVALSERLEDGHKKGINALEMMNFETGEYLSSVIVYKTRSNDRGLVLNFCPWCGKGLNKHVLNRDKSLEKA